MFGTALSTMEWRRQRDKFGTWEAGVVTQARDDAGSAPGGSFGERERSGWIGVGVKVGRYLGFWLEQMGGWSSFTAMGKMGSNRHSL